MHIIIISFLFTMYYNRVEISTFFICILFIFVLLVIYSTKLTPASFLLLSLVLFFLNQNKILSRSNFRLPKKLQLIAFLLLIINRFQVHILIQNFALEIINDYLEKRRSISENCRLIGHLHYQSSFYSYIYW